MGSRVGSARPTIALGNILPAKLEAAVLKRDSKAHARNIVGSA